MVGHPHVHRRPFGLQTQVCFRLPAVSVSAVWQGSLATMSDSASGADDIGDVLQRGRALLREYDVIGAGLRTTMSKLSMLGVRMEAASEELVKYQQAFEDYTENRAARLGPRSCSPSRSASPAPRPPRSPSRSRSPLRRRLAPYRSAEESPRAKLTAAQVKRELPPPPPAPAGEQTDQPSGGDLPPPSAGRHKYLVGDGVVGTEPLERWDVWDSEERALIGHVRRALAHGVPLAPQLCRGCTRPAAVRYGPRLRVFKGWIPISILARDLHVSTDLVRRWGKRNSFEISSDAGWIRAVDTPTSKCMWLTNLRLEWAADRSALVSDTETARHFALALDYHQPPAGVHVWHVDAATIEAAEAKLAQSAARRKSNADAPTHAVSNDGSPPPPSARGVALPVAPSGEIEVDYDP